jgi:hypothetical protein
MELNKIRKEIYSIRTELYLCTFFEVYKPTRSNNDYKSTQITNDLGDFHPTSMTFDSDDNIWANKQSHYF